MNTGQQGQRPIMRRMGAYVVESGKGQQVIATYESETPRPLTIYSSVDFENRSTDDPHPWQPAPPTAFQPRLWIDFGAGAATSGKREIPCGKHFGIVAGTLRIFAETWKGLDPAHNAPVAVDVARATYSVFIGEGVADPSLPTIWTPSEISTATDARLGTTQNAGGILSQVPCVLLSIVGYNGGASSRWFQLSESVGAASIPKLEVPVGAGQPFSIDLSATGGRAFRSLTWAASSTPGKLAADYDAAFTVSAELAFL